MRFSALALLLLASVASATTTTTTTLAPASTQQAGTLTTAQVVSGAGNGSVCVRGSAAVLVIDMVGSSTPSASFVIEHTNGTDWAILTTPSFVAMTAIALSTSPTSVSIAIPNPIGCYRTNITTYSTGSFTATYQIQAP